MITWVEILGVQQRQAAHKVLAAESLVLMFKQGGRPISINSTFEVSTANCHIAYWLENDHILFLGHASLYRALLEGTPEMRTSLLNFNFSR